MARQIEFLYFADCPSHEEALALLREVAAELELDQAIEVTEVRSDAEALAHHFPGSPTIRVDGVDIDPAGAEGRAALSCRIYRLPDGRVEPLPSRERIVEALR
jgi:hypothetical protein